MISENESRSVVSDSLQSHGLYSPWNSLGQNTGVGSLSLFQGIFPTQGSKQNSKTASFYSHPEIDQASLSNISTSRFLVSRKLISHQRKNIKNISLKEISRKISFNLFVRNIL